MPPRRRRHGLELGLILLLNELLQFGMKNIPPVTLFTILGQTLLYMGLINVPWDKEEVCISAHSIMKQKDWKRLFLSALEHGDDMHLYYNMASFLIKGRSLERRYGSKNFAIILFTLTVMTSMVYVMIGHLMSEMMETESYMKSCAIGFSGVIFALKVLTTHEEPSMRAMVVGMQIPGKYAAWVELILIHMLVPNSSFMGHLAGILSGIVYCKTFVGSIIDKFICFVTGDPVVHGGEQANSYTFRFGGNSDFGSTPSETNYSEMNENDYGWNRDYFDQFNGYQRISNYNRYRYFY